MLHEFLQKNRTAVLDRSREKILSRPAPRATDDEITRTLPVFVDQLIEQLRRLAGLTPTEGPEISATSTEHGAETLRLGLPIVQVVYDIGAVCDSVTTLAHERRAQISAHEFHTLNRCVDEAIAAAVSEYAEQRDAASAREEAEHLGTTAHELRNALAAAQLAFAAIKLDAFAANGKTGHVLERNLLRMRDIVDRSLVQARMGGALELRVATIDLGEMVDDLGGSIAEAAERRLSLVLDVDQGTQLEADRHLLVSAVSNLLQNAIKFTRPGGQITLRGHRGNGRVVIEVEDECGGLPPGKAEELFRPFTQKGADRSGLGLGLTIVQQIAQAHHGEIRARDIPGQGCVFTFEVPAHPPRAAAGAR